MPVKTVKERKTMDQLLTVYKERLNENIDRIAQYDMSNRKVFGSAYCVYQDGNIVEKCYGTQSPDVKTPVTSSTLFRLASMTKPVTAVAVMILVERGWMSLDDTVDRFLPEFKNIGIIDASGNSSRPRNLPTVKHLLTHTSGIGSDPLKICRSTAEDQKSLDAALGFYLRQGLDFEPGSMQAYSGIGAFDVLARMVEVVTKTDFLAFLKKEIFEPCEMYDTTFVPTSDQWARTVKMHDRKNGENVAFEMTENCVFESIPCTHYLGGAGLVSTLHDYCNFAKMLLCNGQTENKRILKEESVRMIATPHFPKRETESWGLGVRVVTGNTPTLLPIGSFGWSGAYGSHFWVDPANRICAVFMKNSKIDGGDGNESAKNFERAVYSLLTK